ncbi:3958_t:CDS:2 [Acaulospora colombiana]|uniref:3958_t:CDS:1 n=1 Tax=Acaulospora colombiana TaxID=27376 RepID=A0ACA9KCC0_9GLOM|nr:3958_t:CDS:2 [Acaulospora colombiana]
MLRRNNSLWRNSRSLLIPCSLVMFTVLALCWINFSSASVIYGNSPDLLKRSHLGDDDNINGLMKKRNSESRSDGKISRINHEKLKRDNFLQGEINSNHDTWAKRATTTETSPTCGTQCTIAIVVGSILLFLFLAYGIFRFIRSRRLKSKVEDISKSGKTSVSGSPENHPLILPDTIPGPTDTCWNISNQESSGVNFAIAERFTLEHPPQEELPPLDVISEIHDLGGARAWKWLPVDSLMTEQTISITEDGKVINFNKRTDSMIQSNYPFFIPVEEGKTIFEDPFEQPETAVHRSGQPIHYFEITVVSNPEKNNIIAIGVATKPYPPFRLPGLNVHSVGYHSNGRKFNDSSGGTSYGSPWGEVGDTIGYNPATGGIFFTKNGSFLGNAFTGTQLQHKDGRTLIWNYINTTY